MSKSDNWTHFQGNTFGILHAISVLATQNRYDKLLFDMTRLLLNQIITWTNIRVSGEISYIPPGGVFQQLCYFYFYFATLECIENLQMKFVSSNINLVFSPKKQ